MDDQTVILVDKRDKFLGYASREEAHLGKGKRHRAFVTLLFDSQNNVILHRRKHKLFDGLWDLTAISHPLHVGRRDESYQEASDRALLKEMGIKNVAVEKVGAFNYFAKDGKNCENEYCAVLVGTFDGKFQPNKKEVYAAKKVPFDEFLGDVSKNPKKYTPWAVLAALRLAALAQGKLFQSLQGSTPNLLQTELAAFLKVFEPYFRKYFEKKIKEGFKYSPLIARFYKDLFDYSSGGKRLRAFLVFLGCRVGGQRNISKVLPIALAFEIAHSFLLIHDDVIDQSNMRRGKPTIHKKYGKDFGGHYGQSQAIILGDVACFEAIKLVNESDFSEEKKKETISLLLSILCQTGFGQAMDVEFVHTKPKFDDVLKMTELKTAKYTFVGPLLVGGAFGKLKAVQKAAIEVFGTNVGLAYQLQDDILGVFGSEKIIGKSVLSDMREGKNTLLIYKTREMVKGSKLLELNKNWGNRASSVKELEKVREIIRESGALEWCRQENVRLVERAKSSVSGITGDENLRLLFAQIADFAIFREK